ncbi:MAG: glycosyltransferase family 2 protein, partial [Candidatus Gastranaerophilaceae bacterium]
MCKVSVIIPIYNVEQYLARCLDSVINQTYKNLEIICVNDCSPDNSINILEEYSQKDNRIKIIQREKNGGLSAARNSGFDIAVGEYVYFLDSDDWIDLDYIEKMVAIASKYDSDIVLNTNIVYEYSDKPSKEFVWYTYHEKSPDGVVLSREMAVNFTHCMTPCHLYKRDFILNHHFTFPEGYKHEDNYYNHVTKISTDKIIAFYG